MISRSVFSFSMGLLNKFIIVSPKYFLHSPLKLGWPEFKSPTILVVWDCRELERKYLVLIPYLQRPVFKSLSEAPLKHFATCGDDWESLLIQSKDRDHEFQFQPGRFMDERKGVPFQCTGRLRTSFKRFVNSCNRSFWRVGRTFIVYCTSLKVVGINFTVNVERTKKN